MNAERSGSGELKAKARFTADNLDNPVAEERAGTIAPRPELPLIFELGVTGSRFAHDGDPAFAGVVAAGFAPASGGCRSIVAHDL